MDMKHKVVLAYLQQYTASAVIPDEAKSKEDMATQTRAVERLLKNVITEKMPEYTDKAFSVVRVVQLLAFFDPSYVPLEDMQTTAGQYNSDLQRRWL